MERVTELNHIRDSVNIVLSEYVFIDDDNRIRVFGVFDDISLVVIDGKVAKIDREKKFFLALVFLNCYALKNFWKKKQIKEIGVWILYREKNFLVIIK